MQDELRSGRLARVLERFEVPAISVNVVYPGGRFTTARQRAFAHFLKEALPERVHLRDRLG